MNKSEIRIFLILAFFMAAMVAVSNYLVQFPFKFWGMESILTYGAFSYPITFLITDLSNRRFGKNIAKKIVYVGFFFGVALTIFFSSKKRATRPLRGRDPHYRNTRQSRSSTNIRKWDRSTRSDTDSNGACPATRI